MTPTLCRLTVLILVVSWSVHAVPAQDTSTCSLRIGTNLAGPSDYGAEWPFVDIMHNARTWIPHNATWIDGGQNAWDSGVLDQIPVDENGYPLEIPYAVPGAEAEQVVRTVWANTGKLPAGDYTVLWSGEGDLSVWGDATELTNAPGRMTFRLDPRPDGLFALEIERSAPGDHVHDIRVILPGHEATYDDEPWTPSWIEGLEPFVALRFMDWGHTNNSTLEHWADRPRLDDFTWTPQGVPYELWADVCNMLEKDAWVCVPHLADDDYVRQMAQLFHDRLDPERTIYLEYSNEIWNWMFDQTHYCNDTGDQGVPWPERTAPFVQNVFDIWSEVFADDMDRLVRVVGVQGSWQDVSNRVVGRLRPGSFDAFAPAAYFHFPSGGIADLESRGADATAADVLTLAWDAVRGEAFASMRSQKQSIADLYDIPMLYYEGGQHLTPDPFGSEQDYGPALVAANRDPGMYELYTAWLDSLETLASPARPALFMNFSYIAPVSARYGSWGATERQFDMDTSRQASPKYAALVDRDCDDRVSIDDPRDPDDATPTWPGLRLSSVAPNPFNPRTMLRFDLPGDVEVALRVYDLRGRIVDRIVEGPLPSGSHERAWAPGPELPSGVYLVRLEANGHLRVRKAMLVR